MHIVGADLHCLAECSPPLAVALLDESISNSRAYSPLIHMPGTRSAAKRMARLLLLLVDLKGRRDGGGVGIGRSFSHDDLAKLVGSTRQWVTKTLSRFREHGFIDVTPTKIVIVDKSGLRRFAVEGVKGDMS